MATLHHHYYCWSPIEYNKNICFQPFWRWWLPLFGYTSESVCTWLVGLLVTSSVLHPYSFNDWSETMILLQVIKSSHNTTYTTNHVSQESISCINKFSSVLTCFKHSFTLEDCTCSNYCCYLSGYGRLNGVYTILLQDCSEESLTPEVCISLPVISILQAYSYTLHTPTLLGFNQEKLSVKCSTALTPTTGWKDSTTKG